MLKLENYGLKIKDKVLFQNVNVLFQSTLLAIFWEIMAVENPALENHVRECSHILVRLLGMKKSF